MSNSHILNDLINTNTVYMNLDKRTEQASGYVSGFYNISSPRIAVGTERETKDSAYCLSPKRE